MKRKIAIACQGGGSHAAFTAGALQTFFANNLQNKFEIVSISGTSGGAICASLSIYAKVSEPLVWEFLDISRFLLLPKTPA